MGRARRQEEEKTKKLLSCWVTPTELALIRKAIRVSSEGTPMSEFLREIIIKSVRTILIEDKFGRQLIKVPEDKLPEVIKKLRKPKSELSSDFKEDK